MQVNSLSGFKNSPSFNGVCFVNKEVMAKAGKTLVKEILDNEAVKQYTTRLDYDLFIRQRNNTTEWSVCVGGEDNLRNLPWIPILDNGSLTKKSVASYISKFLSGSNSTKNPIIENTSSREYNKLVNDMVLVENAAKYRREMKERVEWLD